MRTVGPSSLLQDVCPCKFCKKLSHAVYLLPLCSSCTEYNVNSFVQFSFFACESLAVSLEGQSSESEWISCLRCGAVLACWYCKKGARRIGSSFACRCNQCVFFVVARNAISLTTLLVILPRVVLLRNRLWCQWPSHQSVLIVPCNFDMSTRVRTTLAVSVANSWAVEFEAVRCALFQHGQL